MKYPCYNCPDRQQSCHSGCEKYKAFRKRNIETNAKRKAEAEKTGISVRGSVTRHRRNDKSPFRTHKR